MPSYNATQYRTDNLSSSSLKWANFLSDFLPPKWELYCISYQGQQYKQKKEKKKKNHFRVFRGCLDNKKPSLNFRHSISITHHSSLITHILSLITHHSNFHIRLPSSSNSYHSIFLTLFMDPTTVTVSASSVLLPACHCSHQYFFFLISPFPFSPVSLPKQKPKPRKMSQPPSPNQYHHHR